MISDRVVESSLLFSHHNTSDLILGVLVVLGIERFESDTIEPTLVVSSVRRMVHRSEKQNNRLHIITPTWRYFTLITIVTRGLPTTIRIGEKCRLLASTWNFVSKIFVLYRLLLPDPYIRDICCSERHGACALAVACSRLPDAWSAGLLHDGRTRVELVRR